MNAKMKAVLMSGGAPPSYDLINKELKDSDYLICADSGGNFLYEHKIIPDFLMGDFDSIDKDALNFFSKHKDCMIEGFPKDKDFTDTELIFNKAINLGVTEIVFLGCTGTRVDHMMGNIGILLKCLELNVKACIKDNHNIINISNRSVKIKGKRGSDFSLQAYCECVKNLNIKGAKYKLEDYNLRLGDCRTISNQFLDEEVEVSFEKGTILIFYSRD